MDLYTGHAGLFVMLSRAAYRIFFTFFIGEFFQVILGQDIRHFDLTDGQVFLVFQYPAHGFGVFRFVSLCAQRVDRRTF